VRIGILEADTLEPNIKEKYGSYAEMFQRLFLSVNDRIEFKVYRVIDDCYPDDIDECNGFLITGSKSSAYDNESWIIKLRNYIVELHKREKKLIGICFGHQLIAQALGGLTKKNEHGWGVGKVMADLQINKSWIHHSIKKFSLLMSHQDQVVSLPGHAELIASNAFCPNAAFQVGNNILTFQGHPEFSNDYLKYLMSKRRDKIGKEKYNKAIDSLCKKNDGQLVAQWIINFISEDTTVSLTR